MQISSIEQQINAYTSQGKKLFATSSFQTQSAPLLHILSRIDRSIPIYFLNTGYLFPETLRYKDLLAERLGLRIIPLYSDVPKFNQRVGGRLLYEVDVDRCCFLNKTMPLQPVLAQHDVWINGVRADQTSHRKTLAVIETGPFGTLRYHPLLHWTSRDIYRYRTRFDLPRHPLDDEGYTSIGCQPCTRPFAADRDGRWLGLQKSECGLHTELRVAPEGK